MKKSTCLVIVIITIILVALSCSNPTEPESNIPSSPFPANGATILISDYSLIPDSLGSMIIDSILFSWACTESDMYEIYLGTTPNPPLYYSNLELKSLPFPIRIATEMGTYYWRVVSHKDGESFSSDVWNFKLKYSGDIILDTIPTPNLPGFILTKHNILTGFPSNVNILFQVTDGWGKGIDSFQTSDFEVLEDGSKVSPTETFMQIKKKNVIPYTLKTILLLDNSLSVASNITQIKAAAISLVENIEEKQQICIYKFSSQPVRLQSYTNNVQLLKDAINSIEPEYASTNLYGAITTCLSQWSDRYNENYVEQGFLAVLTDGSDTQGSSTLESTLAARGGKKIYTIGLGNEIEPDVLSQLGNAGFFPISSADSLKIIFDQIQEEMKDYANSFYWMIYTSPKRQNNNHTLTLSLIDNEYTGDSSSFTGDFNSASFCDVLQGTFINIVEQCNDASKYGIDSLYITNDGTISIDATTYLGKSHSYYKWSNSNSNAISLEFPTHIEDNYNNYIVNISPILNNLKDTATILVEDTANGFSKELFITTFLRFFDGFEDGISDNWAIIDGTADWKVVDSISNNGNYCGEFHALSPNQSITRNFDVPPNKNITITFTMITTDFSVNAGEYFGLLSNGVHYLNLNENTAQWTVYSLTRPSDSNGKVNFEWKFTTPISNDFYFWIDDIVLTW